MEQPTNNSVEFNSTYPAAPKLSQCAIRAIEVFTATASPHVSSGILERAARVTDTLEGFVEKNEDDEDVLTQHGYDAAALQEPAAFVYAPHMPRRNQAAAKALHAYFHRNNGDPLRPSNGYVGVLLGDQPHNQKAASWFMPKLEEHAPHTAAQLRGDEEIPRQAWLNLRVGANIPEIARVRRQTNIESRLMLAAYRLDQIVHDNDDDSQLLLNVLQAESFDSVQLDSIGYMGFDMLTHSNTDKVRVMKSGNEWALEEAMGVLNSAKRIDTKEILREVFGVMPSNHTFETRNGSLYGERIVFTSSSIDELSQGKQAGGLNARFKTEGKYALKRIKQNAAHAGDTSVARDYGLSDTFGMLAVLPDDKQMIEFFVSTVRQVKRNESLRFAVSAPKTRPLYVQGSHEYKKRIMGMIPDEFHKYIEVDGGERDYQVVKFYCRLRQGEITVPIEVQMQTTADRECARFGAASHTNYNASRYNGIANEQTFDISRVTPGTADDLRVIYGDRDKINSTGDRVKPASIPHGEEFRDRYYRALGRSVLR